MYVVSGFPGPRPGRRTLPKSKCGERSSAIAGPRAKFALTHESTRSNAAAYGSAASGSASNVWQAIPAERITSRAT